MLGSILSAFGLGQKDLRHVFEETLKRLDRLDLQTAELRRGQAQAVETMMQVLRDEDVMSSETMVTLRGRLERWLANGPRR